MCETRRAVAERAENIGIWFKILDMLAQLAVISNVSQTFYSDTAHCPKNNLKSPQKIEPSRMEGTLDVTANTIYGTLSVHCTLYSMSGLCAKYVNKSQPFTIASALAVTGLVFTECLYSDYFWDSAGA